MDIRSMVKDAIRRLATNTYTMGEDKAKDTALLAMVAIHGIDEASELPDTDWEDVFAEPVREQLMIAYNYLQESEPSEDAGDPPPLED